MKVAYYSPLSPLKTGVAVHSENHFLPYVSKYLDIDLIIDDGYKPSNKYILENFNIVRYGEIRKSIYDLFLYAIGNNPFHEYIYRAALERQGILILHDVFIGGLIWNMTVYKGNSQQYVNHLTECYGEAGKKDGEIAVRTGVFPTFKYPMIKKIAENSIGIIVTNNYSKTLASKEAPNSSVRQINLPIAQRYISVSHKDKIRKSLKIDEDAVIISSFGHLYRHKRIETVMKAFRKFHESNPNSALMLIGGVSTYDGYDKEIMILAEKLGISKCLVITGSQDFSEHLAISDIFVQLRYPTAGETSAGTLELMSMEKPIIVSNVGWFSDLPSDCVLKLDMDGKEDDTLAQLLSILAYDGELRRKLASNSFDYVRNHHDPEKIASKYYAYLKGVSQKETFQIINDLGNSLGDIGLTDEDVDVIKEFATTLKHLKVWG